MVVDGSTQYHEPSFTDGAVDPLHQSSMLTPLNCCSRALIGRSVELSPLFRRHGESSSAQPRVSTGDLRGGGADRQSREWAGEQRKEKDRALRREASSH
ncbi:hypothetical protein Q5P01_004013 [Channa striata]|uniref:Uncharacterized protein n=1 Tax=Channa striata TaxID=64152 RepID=A0AA88T0V2_CHASR|nr:hypothetical protein Q5P01_004013 [Channa striata]